MSEIVIPSASSVEKLAALVVTDTDPTGDAPEWQATATGGPATDDWETGEWDGTYSSGRATALSPVIATLGIDEVGTWRLWVRWTVGSETPVRMAGQVKVTA
jgi:hypothetical protein